MSVYPLRTTFSLFLLIILSSLDLCAQVSFGLTVGVNQSSMQYRDPLGRADESKRPLRRVSADFQVHVPIVYNALYVVPALRYVTKGANLTVGHLQGGNAESTRRLEVHYLELPVNFLYKIPVSFGRIALGAGPYAAYGLCGNNRLQVYNAGALVSVNEYSVGFSRHVNKGIYPGTRLNRWDIGGQVSAGLEFSNLLMVGVHYSQGIRNLDLSGNSRIRNSSIGVSVGVILSREDY